MSKQQGQRTEAQIQADKARTGRPRKAKAAKQSERITVHLTPAERKRIEKLAKAEGITLPAMIMRPWREEGAG